MIEDLFRFSEIEFCKEYENKYLSTLSKINTFLSETEINSLGFEITRFEKFYIHQYLLAKEDFDKIIFKHNKIGDYYINANFYLYKNREAVVIINLLDNDNHVLINLLYKYFYDLLVSKIYLLDSMILMSYKEKDIKTNNIRENNFSFYLYKLNKENTVFNLRSSIVRNFFAKRTDLTMKEINEDEQKFNIFKILRLNNVFKKDCKTCLFNKKCAKNSI